MAVSGCVTFDIVAASESPFLLIIFNLKMYIKNIQIIQLEYSIKCSFELCRHFRDSIYSVRHHLLKGHLALN